MAGSINVLGSIFVQTGYIQYISFIGYFDVYSDGLVACHACLGLWMIGLWMDRRAVPNTNQ